MKRSWEEIELLLEQAQAEIDFQWNGQRWKEHHPDRLLTMWCSRPAEAAEGIKQTCLWMLGRRGSAPLTDGPCTFPPTKQEIAEEHYRARDVVEQLIPEWREIGPDYAAAYIETLAWMRNLECERPIAEPGSRSS
ncbi:hypothetical protein ACPC54_40330 [Kitasatospora sp. NPDC094028]